LAKQSFQTDQAPHAEVLERDLLTYPGGQGVFSSNLQGLWFGPGQERVFRADSSGTVKEISLAEEKIQWTESRQRWHNFPADLRGNLTHLDETGQKWGFLSYSEAGTAEAGVDGFRPTRWFFEQYRALAPEAGPEDQVILTAFEEDPEKPVEAQIHRVHRSALISGSARSGSRGSVWGQMTAWTYAAANIHKIYSIIHEERKYFQGGVVPVSMAADQLRQAILAKGQGESRQVSWAGKGCRLRDLDSQLEGRFHEFGHPPGVMVELLDASGSAARAGLKEGDVVVLIDWQRISSVTEAEKVLAGSKPEEGWPLLYWRKGVYWQCLVQCEMNDGNFHRFFNEFLR